MKNDIRFERLNHPDHPELFFIVKTYLNTLLILRIPQNNLNRNVCMSNLS